MIFTGAVLIHCLAGVSRSVTLATAYIMTITNLSWSKAVNVVRGARRIANPNFGFKRQLKEFERKVSCQSIRQFSLKNIESIYKISVSTFDPIFKIILKTISIIVAIFLLEDP